MYWEPAGKVDVEHLLEVLEVDNIRREGRDEYRFSCPYPGHENGDMSASAYMNSETTTWYCHGCKRKGNSVSFVSSLMSISPIKARQLLRQAYDPSSLNPDDRNMVAELTDFFARQKERKESRVTLNVVIPEKSLAKFDVDWERAYDAWQCGVGAPCTDYMFERGFTPKTLVAWNFGWDERTDRITFAVRNEYGELVGVKGRAWDDRHPKYLVIGDAEGRDPYYGFGRYQTGQVVFGLDHSIRNDRIVVCEGELNAIALHQMHVEYAVALNGSNLTDHHVRLIKRHAESVVFLFDPDKAGHEGLWGRDDKDTGEHTPGALEKLADDMPVFLVGPHDGDPADWLKAGTPEVAYDLLAKPESYISAKLRRMSSSLAGQIR